MQGIMWVQDHPWAQGRTSQRCSRAALGSVCIWPGQDGDFFPFTGNHSCLYKMGIPAMRGKFQGPSHTRPLCGGTVGHAGVPLNLLVS